MELVYLSTEIVEDLRSFLTEVPICRTICLECGSCECIHKHHKNNYGDCSEIKEGWKPNKPHLDWLRRYFHDGLCPAFTVTRLF